MVDFNNIEECIKHVYDRIWFVESDLRTINLKNLNPDYKYLIENVYRLITASRFLAMRANIEKDDYLKLVKLYNSLAETIDANNIEEI